MSKEEFSGWVTETCKKCKKAFMFNDRFGQINDTPSGLLLCPTCAKKAKLTPSQFLNNNLIKDKIIRQQFIKIHKRNKEFNPTYEESLKQAIEVAGYIKEEQKEI